MICERPKFHTKINFWLLYNRYEKTIDFWKDVYGFQMSCMKEPVLTEASIEVIPKEKVASNLAEILRLDLTKCKVEDFAEFSTDFELEINCDRYVMGKQI